MTGVAVVTGGGTGIGAALAKRLAQRGPVLIVGRRAGPLQDTRGAHPENIRTVEADLTTSDGRASVVAAIGDGETVSVLVHNAGMLEPIGPLAEVDPDKWRAHMAVNVDAPLFLTQALLPKLSVGGRVLHISSGAAHKAYQGWGPYCTSKAALNMVYRCLAQELGPRGVHVGSARPGVVDTPMQDRVRQTDEAIFPDLPRFLKLKESGSLKDPDEVAKFLDWLLNGTSPEEFSAEEWDIRDEENRNRWATF